MESEIVLKYGNEVILNIIKTYDPNFKYKFDSEYGLRYYTLAELKDMIRQVAKSYLKEDYYKSDPDKIEKACNIILADSLELTCKNLIIPDDLIIKDIQLNEPREH